MIGSALTQALEARGDTVHRLVRGAKARGGDVRWSPLEGTIDDAALVGHDAVVHLAGEPIAGRWTSNKRSAIHESRVLGTELLTSALARIPTRPDVLVCASAAGFYGDGKQAELTEESPQGRGFLAQVVKDWEAAAEPALAAGIRTVHLRAGMVLSPRGGALQQLMLPFRMGVGGRVGSGRQYWAWIGLHELVGLFLRALDDSSMRGVYNAVAPQQTTNREFTRTFGKVLGRPTFLPAPAAALRLALGDLADEMLLASQRVVPQRLTASHHDWQDADLEATLRREIAAG